MHNPTADEIIEDLKRFPNQRKLPLDYDSLGSPYTAFEATPEVIRTLAKHPVVNAFRRVLLEPARGLVMMTSPSGAHETQTRQVDKIVDAAIEILSLTGHMLGSTRWSNRGEGNDTGTEPDCCYYLGDNALACPMEGVHQKKSAKRLNKRFPLMARAVHPAADGIRFHLPCTGPE